MVGCPAVATASTIFLEFKWCGARVGTTLDVLTWWCEHRVAERILVTKFEVQINLFWAVTMLQSSQGGAAQGEDAQSSNERLHYFSLVSGSHQFPWVLRVSKVISYTVMSNTRVNTIMDNSLWLFQPVPPFWFLQNHIQSPHNATKQHHSCLIAHG